MDDTSSLRERKKQQTKAALAASAYKLFRKHGYYLTSIDDIATDANFAPRTFFLHFTSKEDLLFPDADLIKASLEIAMSNRGNTSTLTALEEWIQSLAGQKQSQDTAVLKLRKRIIDADKSLQAREKLYLSTIEEVLAKEIAKDLQLKPHDLVPQLIAAASIAVFTVVNEHVEMDLSAKEAAGHIAVAMKFLRNGLLAIR